MSRTFHDLSPAEQNAYQVYQSKLADRTLPASEHDRIRKAIDELLWKGPNAKVQALAKEVADLSAKTAAALNRILDRIERLEFHAGLSELPDMSAISKMADMLNGPAGTVASTPFPRPPLRLDPSREMTVTLPVVPDTASVAAPTDPFDLPEYRTAPAGLAPCGQFAVDPHPSDADHGKPVLSWPAQVANGETVVLNSPAPAATDPTPDEKKPGRGRPKGAKNKPKSPPVASGEGNEQAATEVVQGVVTAPNPSFTDQMVSGEGEDAAPTDDFWQS